MKKIIILLMTFYTIIFSSEYVTMKKGWNLTTLPTSSSIDITKAESIWHYNSDTNSWYAYFKESQNQSYFTPLQETSTSKGYWVYSLDEFNVTFESNITQEFDFATLPNGWNLLGTFNGIDDFSSIQDEINLAWIYVDNNWYVKSFNEDLNQKIEDLNYSSFTSINPKSGFWIYKDGVVNHKPSSIVSIDNISPLKLENINFSSNNTDLDLDELTYFWDFGDGATSNDKDALHKYEQAGIYNVTFTVIDSKGSSDTKTFTIEVLDEYITPETFSSLSFPCTINAVSEDMSTTFTIEYISDSQLSIDTKIIYDTSYLRDGGLNVEDAIIDFETSYLNWDGEKFYAQISVSDKYLINYSDNAGYIKSKFDKYRRYMEYYPYSDLTYGKNIMMTSFDANYGGKQSDEYNTYVNNLEYSGSYMYNLYYDNFENEFNNLEMMDNSSLDGSDSTQWDSTCQMELTKLFR